MEISSTGILADKAFKDGEVRRHSLCPQFPLTAHRLFEPLSSLLSPLSPLSSPIQEDVSFLITPTAGDISIANDCFSLSDRTNAKQRLALSYAIAQSGILNVLETRIENRYVRIVYESLSSLSFPVSPTLPPSPPLSLSDHVYVRIFS